MTNAAKYSDTPKVEVSITDTGDCLAMTVKDYGKGFRIEDNNAATSGLGLHGMRERVESVQGTFSVQSSPESGTEVRARIPLDDDR